ncbi:hypothetical protein AB1Y20_003372 [Prymnesium parvum]|uniref:Phosphate transporter n=1 Tax=Prymnesium parvum TaxID=97485 RepID=A0AB34JD50_PRYPA|mmetsp:Transcript_30157/g.69201  ORF Transcript_30157/g.69201 Transcript_30157/m.69201 type:complete len:556 (+) Transcript_30157:23-1690(+)
MAGSDEWKDEWMWIVPFGGIVAFIAAFGIGANDVANAYATSVGSKALTIKQACFLAVIFEFLGAFLAGSQVADTIRSGIADYKCFTDTPEILMYGNMCVIISVAMWLILATKYEMPVSTTHSCVGGMIGMTIVAKGSDCVVWSAEGNEYNLYLPKGVVAIILSWILSPVLSGMFSSGMFLVLRAVVLRASNSFRMAIKLYPVLIFVAVMLNVFFIISKGLAKKICPSKSSDPGFLCEEKDGVGTGKVDAMVALGLSAGVAAGVALACYPLYSYISRRVEERTVNDASKATADAEKKSSTIDVAEVSAVVEPAAEQTRSQRVISVLMTSLNTDVHLSKDTQTMAVHDNAEKFDARTEMVFEYIQIFTAIVDSFAHGANDVANAMGPFMAIHAIHKTGKVGKKAEESEEDGLWILALGGIGIGVGLCLYGYQIIRAIGVKLAAITPPRGVCIELGSAVVIIFGSFLGLPLSTTHCQVGATTGVALLEGKGGVNTWVLFKTVIGWIITLIVVGFSTGSILAWGLAAPVFEGKVNVYLDEGCPDWATSHDYIINATALA